MIRRLAGLLAAVLLLLDAGFAAAAGDRVALVIGNGAYRFAKSLPNPSHDAADIARALRKIGFEVVEGRDLDKRGMEDKIRAFGRSVADAKLALFFYAGHGMQVGGRNYLVPIDAKLEKRGDLNLDTIDLSLVLAQMEADQRANLIFLDACRDNPLTRSFARSLGTRSTAVGQGLASVQTALGTMIAFATQPGAVALDGRGRNSPFTSALLKHIATPGLDVAVLMRRVRVDVVNATRKRQVPWDHSSLTGDVVLNLGAATITPPPKATAPALALAPATPPAPATATAPAAPVKPPAAAPTVATRRPLDSDSGIASSDVAARVHLPRHVSVEPISGAWKGDVVQFAPANNYATHMEIETDGRGTIAYPSLQCGGRLKFVVKSGPFFTFRETITYGRDKCVDGGVVVLTREGERLKWDWTHPNLTVKASAVLSRATGR